MSLFLIFKAIILGLVEGLTEFLPVSSTGHLIIFSELLNFNHELGKVFKIVIQAGAILAVCVVYFEKLFSVATNFHKSQKARNFVYNILIAFLPAVFLGVLLHEFIKTVLFSSFVVAISLIIGGVIMIIIDQINMPKKITDIDQLNYKTALKIGLCQVIAMIPGVSRSGSTIIGAMCFGVSRKVAAEFSFFLAVPTIFGAATFDLLKSYDNLNFDNLLIIFIGFFAAFLASMIVIKAFIAILRHHGFLYFGIYRIILGLIIILAI